MTEEEQQQPENVDSQTGQPSVGARLRDAREALGLDRQSVADRLHLRPTLIAAIEEGDHSEAPGELFLKGYVRTYARLVELSPEELLEQLDQELEPWRREQEAHQQVSPTEEIRQRKEKRRRLGLGGIAVVVLALAAWLFYAYGPFVAEQTGELLGEAGEHIEEVVTDESNGDDVGDSEPEPAMDDAAEEAPATPEENDAGADLPRLSDGPIAQVDTVQESPEAEVAEEVSEPAMAPAEDDVSLSMSFSGECWVEVVNGEGERAVVQLARDGDTIDYSGPGPLEVLLGNVEAVSDIRFMGEPVNLDDYPATAGRSQFVLAASES